MDKPVIVWDSIDEQAEREAHALQQRAKGRQFWGVVKPRFTAQRGGIRLTPHVVRHDNVRVVVATQE